MNKRTVENQIASGEAFTDNLYKDSVQSDDLAGQRVLIDARPAFLFSQSPRH